VELGERRELAAERVVEGAFERAAVGTSARSRRVRAGVVSGSLSRTVTSRGSR
jgi:hypothetical protein